VIGARHQNILKIYLLFFSETFFYAQLTLILLSKMNIRQLRFVSELPFILSRYKAIDHNL